MAESIYTHPQLRGVLIRAYWSALEPKPGSFDFSRLKVQVAKVGAAGKPWSLAVMAGGTGSPAWLIDDLKVPFIDYSFRGKFGNRLPLFWDRTVQAQLKKLAQALAKEYGDDPLLSLIYVPQMTANGIEGHLQGVSMQTMKAAGYTDDKWVAAASDCARSFAHAFPRKAIAIEVHEINGAADVPARIINDLWSDPDLQQRVGAAMWWLSGRTNYQTALIEVLKKFPGDIYAQVIGRSDQTHRFKDGDYTAVFAQAKVIGVRYIEPWEYEFKKGARNANGQWDAAMSDFNDWADTTYAKASDTPKR